MKAEFYKMDFRAWNNGTVDLNLEQEAAYLRLCHAMYDNRGPVPDSSRLLQGIFRCGNVKAVALLRQLIEAGKIERTADGKLSNRRVLKELADRETLSEARRVAGGKGGSARREEDGHYPSEVRVNPECLPSDPELSAECLPSETAVTDDNPLINHGAAGAIASTPGSREEERRGESPIVPIGTEPEGFAEFRKTYAKRNTAFPTTQARKRWREALRRGADPAEINAGARGYTAEQTRNGKIGTEYVQSADAWLNKQRWRDYLDQPQETGTDRPDPTTYLAGLSDERWRAEVGTWRARLGHWPLKNRTPPPDNPRTAVPPRILAEFGIVHPGAHTEPPMTRAS